MHKKIINIASMILITVLSITVMISTYNRTVRAEGTDQTLLTSNSNWRYLDDNADPALGTILYEQTSGAIRNQWTYPPSYPVDSQELGFDDSTWKEASGPFGFKIDLEEYLDINTALTANTDGTNNSEGRRIPAYFFRTAFEIEHPEDFNSIYYKLQFKGAVIIYLNGVEIGRYNTPDGGYRENLDYGSATVPDPFIEEEHYVTTSMKDMMQQDMLREGTNILSVELHQNSSDSPDIYLNFTEFTLSAEEVDEYPDLKALTVGPGSNESELRFTWHASTPEPGNVKLYEGEEEIRTFQGTSEAIVNGLFTNKVTVNGLKENTTYSYRVGNGDKWSLKYKIKTGNTPSFSFFFAGDPQIGVKNLENDTEGWKNTIHNAMLKFPDTSFLISAGDLVNVSTNESHYDGYLSPPGLKNLPAAQTAGNHDNAVNYLNHFNLPNLNNTLGYTAAGGDYWFTYGNTLFMMLNSNRNSAAEHKQFMEQAVEKNPKAKFRIAVFHHSLYSAGYHAFDSSILSRRKNWVPILDEMGIDLVLMGHDHGYARTWQMYNDAPVKDVKIENGSAIDPEGTVYITANSSSGSKYYGLQQQEFYFAASSSQLYTATISKIDITEDMLVFRTYRSDTMEAVDDYSIVKTQIDTVNKPSDLVLANVGKTSVKVNWSKVDGIEGYEIWYSTAKDDTYKKADSVNASSYTHKGLSIGRKYYYKVRSYKEVKGKTAYSTFTSIKSLTVPVPQPANVKAASAGAASIKVSWKKVSGASGYRIYRADSKNGSYKKVATVDADKKSYTDKSLNNKKIYYYKVRAYAKIDGSNKYSSYTNAVKKKAILSKPANVKAKRTNTAAIKVSWDKVAGATQYRIYRRIGKKGKYVRIVTVNAAKTSYTNKRLKTNKTYYYKVRAVQKIGGKNYLGGTSAVISAKTT